jgi:chromosome segregation ATPase
MYRTRDEAVPVNPPFEIVLRGFDRQQVIDHVEALKARVAAIGAERDAALRRSADLNEQFEKLRREAAEANAQVERLRRETAEAANRLERSPLTAATTRIQRMLQMAEEEAAELQVSAEQESTALRESARAEAEALLREATQRCKRMEAESERRCEADESESAARYQQAELDSERRRLAAEQRFEHTIIRRRAETEAWVSEYQTRCTAALYLIMQLVAQRLNNRIAEARRQTTALKRLRAEISDQVSAVHRLLVEAVDLVDQPSAAEQAEPLDPVESVATVNGLPRHSGQPTARFGLHP